MADGRVRASRDERTAFRVARREGKRRATAPASALGLAAGVIGLEVFVLIIWLREYSAEGAFPLWGLVAIPAAAVIVAWITRTTIRDMPALVGIRRAWRRAERGEAARVVRGVALGQWRSVGDVPVRTVVAPVDGRPHFVRLAFARAEDAARLPAGPVEVDLFDASAVRGPARLRPARGGVVWAFAVRKGDAPVTEAAPWTAPDEQPDGWPHEEGAADRDPGWPGDSDGGGDGDGDGGE
ncbi:hypothetical protein [Actinomadura sp. 7K534]|uniref:hypothetical protein n=1 Tax=Actinomadura sp. 7K534 TaxID=2530366 RepID=UPI00104C24E6|nr:hypothetical protein [Actinomadura sp. 7K534]TDB97144.1 hypothetical protein E1266_07620 [Actinomadura sp. 7K534]